MARTYILIDSSRRATLIPEGRIQQEAASRLVKGEKFEIYRAEAMKLQVQLTPTAAGAAPVASGGGRRGRRTKKAGRRTKRGAGRVGRPKVNVGPCTVPGCDNPSKTRGLCSAHYQQHRRLIRQGKSGLIRGSSAAAALAKKKGGRKASKKKGRRKMRKKTKTKAA